jgi:uncharacterized protein (TIGR02246 family)
MKALAAALAALLMISCAQAPPPQGDPQRAVTEAIMGMYSAFQTRDLSRVAPYMTEDSTCYNAITSEMLVGRKAVLDHFGAILAQHKEGEKWEASIQDMNVVVRGDLAYATYKVHTSQGGMHSLAAVTHVFKKVDGRWLATHLHRSWNLQPK